MARKFAVVALLVGLATGAFAASVAAQCVSPPLLISWGADALAYEDLYQTAPADSFDSHAGSNLTVVGKIVCFGVPIDWLNANMPAFEYTFVWHLTSLGTVKTVPAGQNGENWDTDYVSGTWTIYEDSTPDSPTAALCPPNPPVAGVVPDLFQDGTPILSGVFDAFHTQVTLRQLLSGGLRFGGSWNANYHCTGGRAHEFSAVGTGVTSAGTTWCTNGTVPAQCSEPAGYSAHPANKFDTPGTITSASGSTWGRLKLLYR